MLCDAAAWRPQINALEQSINCFVPNYESLPSIEAMAQSVLDLAPPGPLALVGHSMGGRVALEMFRQRPERIDRLALLDTGYERIQIGEAGEKERATRHDLLEIARKDGMRTMGSVWAKGMVHPFKRESEVFEAILDMIERKNPDVFASQIEALINRPDATDLLKKISCPTLLMCGRDDAWSPLSRHEKMLEIIRSGSLPPAQFCELSVIQDSGHMTTLEQPEQVIDAMAPWLAVETHS